jgi:hypothetical protein
MRSQSKIPKNLKLKMVKRKARFYLTIELDFVRKANSAIEGSDLIQKRFHNQHRNNLSFNKQAKLSGWVAN